MKRSLAYFAVTLALFASGNSYAQQRAKYCGELKNAYGPFDYRKAPSLPYEINMVEHAHFTPEVEQNLRGKSGVWVGGDVDYTLRAWPNHHRALATMSRQGLLEKTPQVRGAQWPVDCYFLRAFEFAPDDGMLHAIYANHLLAHGKSEQANGEYLRAVALEPDNATINYNAGLASMKSKKYDQALIYAKKAYGQNFPLQGLKNQLKAVGKWDDKPAG